MLLFCELTFSAFLRYILKCCYGYTSLRVLQWNRHRAVDSRDFENFVMYRPNIDHMFVARDTMLVKKTIRVAVETMRVVMDTFCVAVYRTCTVTETM